MTTMTNLDPTGATANTTDNAKLQAEVIESFAILTTEVNDVARPIHNRMPVINPPDAFG